MSLGTFARALLGDRFHTVAKYYRALFVNLDEVAASLAGELPHGAMLLDVGGGDGAPLNALLARRPDLRVIMLDPAPNVGGAIEPRFASRVSFLPATSLREYAGPPPDAMLLLDVFHHVPENGRAGFLAEIERVADRYGVAHILVKDLEPGHLRSLLGWLSDRYVTRDPNVKFIRANELRELLARALGSKYAVAETPLRGRDAPNFCISATRVK